MKRRKNNDTDYSYCVRNGLLIYPVYNTKDGKWRIQVEFNGKVEKVYEKEIGSGLKLTGRQLQRPHEKTAKYWANKLDKAHETNQNGDDRQSTNKVRNK